MSATLTPAADRTCSSTVTAPPGPDRIAAKHSYTGLRTRGALALVPAQRSTTANSTADQITAGSARGAIRAVWTADCSATVELTRLAGPRTGLWRLPDRLAHQHGQTGPCDLGSTECKTALYENCMTIGTQYDIYLWVSLADLVELWPTLVLPAGLKAEWGGALRSAGLLQDPARRESAPARPRTDEPTRDADGLLAYAMPTIR